MYYHGCSCLQKIICPSQFTLYLCKHFYYYEYTNFYVLINYDQSRIFYRK